VHWSLVDMPLFRFPICLSGVAPKWGSEVNEPGGRLFGEAIRTRGERRSLFDWELPLYGTLAVATLMLGIGLRSRPPSSGKVPSKRALRVDRFVVWSSVF
jgi:hypothetical protein